MEIRIIKPGIIEYGKALDMQQRINSERQEGSAKDTLLLLQHYPVITSGIRGDESNIMLARDKLEELGVKVFRTGRGGDITYHGPGQIVGYPIIDLKKNRISAREYIFLLEEVFIQLLEKEFRIKAFRENGKYTGVWVGSSKITAIGVSIKRWVTMHGFAFNVNTNLEHFSWIRPCGITDRGVTSLERLTGEKQDMEKTCDLVEDYFCRQFGFKIQEKEVNAST